MKRALVIAVLAAVAAPGVAAAERCPTQQGPIVSRVVRGPDGPRIVIDTPIEICVSVPAPAVAIVAPTPQMDYEWMTLKQDFLPGILESVKDAVFGGAS